MVKTASTAPVSKSRSPIRVTISLGVAEISECPHHAGPKDFIELTDKRLYQAKQSGRNRIVAC